MKKVNHLREAENAIQYPFMTCYSGAWREAPTVNPQSTAGFHCGRPESFSPSVLPKHLQDLTILEYFSKGVLVTGYYVRLLRRYFVNKHRQTN